MQTQVKQVSLLPPNKQNMPNIELVDLYQQYFGWCHNCELNHKKFWLDNAKPDWVVLDVGANIGIFSILLSRLCKKVYAFEPIQGTLAKLRNNLQHNNCGNVEIIEKAVSNKSGLHKDAIHSLWGHEVQVNSFDFVSLDDWVKNEGITVDALKIDVDGYDYEVLLGAEAFLKEQKPIVVVEVNNALRTRNHEQSDVFSFMERIGYKRNTRLDCDNVLFMWD